jgi:Methyltransferase domain
MDRVPSLEFSGIDVQPRSASAIPVSGYDGRRIDHEDGAFTGALICDVLHHTDDVESVLGEVARVSRSTVIIKDSIADSWLEHKLLSIMDVVGNRPYGVPCPFNFLSSEQWADVFDRIGLSVVSRQRSLHLYPVPFSYIFDGRLHFVASLKKRQPI